MVYFHTMHDMFRKSCCACVVLVTCLVLTSALPLFVAPVAHADGAYTIFVAKNGNDGWSGLLSAPNAGQSDGPFATIDRARQAVASLKQAGSLTSPVNVEIRGGTYASGSALNFGAADSGTPAQPITYEAYNSEEVIISGSQRIASPWTRYASNANIYITHLPEVASGGWNFNSLFVNEARSTRARIPNAGSVYNLDPSVNTPAQNSLYGGGVFLIKNGEVNPNWSNLQDVEVVSDERWTQARERIASITDSGQHAGYKNVTVANPLRDSGEGYGWDYANNDRYYLDNVFEGLTGPGEWYLNRHTGDLYYWPPAGLDPVQADIEAPHQQSLVNFRGQMNRLSFSQAPGFTLSFWVKTAQADTSLLYNSLSGSGYGVSLSGGEMSLHLGTAQVPYDRLCNSAVINDNSWHLLTATVDTTNHVPICYVDGATGYDLNYGQIGNPVNSGPFDLGSNLDSLPVLGGDVGIPPVQFVGSFDEVRMYARAVSNSEVQTLYQHSAPAPTDRLQLSMDFENSLADSGPSGLTGNFTGSMSYVAGIRGQALQILPNSAPSFQSDGVVFPNYAQPVHDITLNGLNFRYSGQPLSSGGFSDPIGGNALPDSPAISLLGTQRIAIKNSTFSHTGGFAIGQAVSDTTSILGNTFSDTAAGGIAIGNDTGEIPTLRNTGNIVSDNVIHDTGALYASSASLLVERAVQSTIAHNTIYNAGYTGLVVGLLQNLYGNEAIANTVEYNDIHDVMKELSDGGGIYSYGSQKGSLIRYNRIHDVANGAGIYLDEQSNGVTASSNLLYRALYGFELHNVNADTVTNNIIADSKSVSTFFSAVNGAGVGLTNNILFDGKVSPANSPYAEDGSTGFSDVPDYNLYSTPRAPTLWNAAIKVHQDGGHDLHSMNADPQFLDYAHDNFALAATSPAYALGFKPFDLSSAGARTGSIHTTSAALLPPSNSIALSMIDGKPIMPGTSIVTSNRRPNFQGIAPPGTAILVTVHSDPLTCSATANQGGTWSCSLSQDLPQGAHTVQISSNGTIFATYGLTVLDMLPVTGGSSAALLAVLIGTAWILRRTRRSLIKQVTN